MGGVGPPPHPPPPVALSCEKEPCPEVQMPIFSHFTVVPTPLLWNLGHLGRNLRQYV